MTFAQSLIGAAVLAVVTTSSTVARAEDEKLSLAEAYRLALKYNDQLLIAVQNVEQEDINIANTWSDVRPTITATGTGFVRRNAAESAVTPQPGFEAAVGLQQPLFRRGFFASRVAARYAYDSANATLSRERQRVARDVAAVFISVNRTRAVVELSKGAVKRATTQYDYAVNRVKAGATLKTAELLADIDVKRAQRQVLSAERDVGTAEAAFRRLIGRAPPKVLDMPPPPAATPPADMTAIAQQRDDVEAIQLQIREAEARIEVAEGQRLWPSLDLQAGASYTATAGTPMGVDGTFVNWQVLGVITIPLLQSGREANAIRSRQNDAHVAQLQLDFQRKLLAAEVEAAWVVVQTTTESTEIAEKQLKVAQDHYTLVDKQFRLGAITFLEVTNALRALSESEQTWEIARADRVQAIYDYLFATGAIDLEATAKAP